MEANSFLDEVETKRDNIALLHGRKVADAWKRDVLVEALKKGGFE